jgi:hypothetical protein
VKNTKNSLVRRSGDVSDCEGVKAVVKGKWDVPEAVNMIAS